MTWMDRWIQQQRFNQVIPNIPSDSIVLDIGCHQGELFQSMGTHLKAGFGIDPLLSETIKKPLFTLIKGRFPMDWNIKTELGCITMLAVLEHIPKEQQLQMVKQIFNLLSPGGLVILTVPSMKTERLLKLLRRMGLIQGMSLEEHYGFDPGDTCMLFEKAGFILLKHQTFEWGLNNLFVFRTTK